MIFFKGKTHKREEEASRVAFQKEALKHMESLYNAALYMTRGQEDAQDLVQETFLKAYRFWDRYQEGTNCKAWLFRIMTNTFINRNRRKQRLLTPIDDAIAEASSATEDRGRSDFYRTPEATYMSRLFPEHVRQAVEELPDNFRIPVVLADLHDFSYKEIADIMECPVGTVMSRLFRGRKKLQETLFEYAVEQGIIPKKSALDSEGTISLDAYREHKKVAG